MDCSSSIKSYLIFLDIVIFSSDPTKVYHLKSFCTLVTPNYLYNLLIQDKKKKNHADGMDRDYYIIKEDGFIDIRK